MIGLAFKAFDFARSRLGIGLIAALALGMMWLRGSHYRDQRDLLQAWQDQVVQATRAAAHMPRLAVKNVPAQVLVLGTALDRIEAAQAQARAEALAEKAARERDQQQQKRTADDALPNRLAENRRRSGAWIAGHGLSGPAAALDHSAAGQGGRDLPSPAFGPGRADSADRGPEFVAVPAAYIDKCDTVTARLQVVQGWWQGINPADFAAEPKLGSAGEP